MSLLVYASLVLSTYLLGFFLPTKISLYVLTCLVGLLVTAAVRVLRKTGKESYDLDHAVLNIQRPASMWLNMGSWKDTNSFSEACEALACKLADFAGVKPGDSILDVGYGCGESIALWAAKYRPSRIVGVTSLASHREEAAAILKNSDAIPMDLPINLYTGDAVSWTRGRAADSGQDGFERILALDCAYHFRTRRQFLESSHRLLEFTGTIGLTDLMLPSSPMSSIDTLALRFVAYMAGVPFSNLIAEEAYNAQLREIGFTDVEIEDISQDVFPGLARYIEELGKDRRRVAALNPGKIAAYKAFAKVLRWWSKGKMRFVLVKAMKGGRSSKHSL